MDRIPFNVPPLGGREIEYLSQALGDRALAGNGGFTGRCHAALRERIGVPEVLLTHSCTAALEMSAILAEIEPGDEVIMPSFTFVSTANAVVLRRGVPVFVDIRPDTLNLDEALIESAITPRTRAICTVHYAGVCAEMDAINAIARRHGLLVIEDAAQAFLSRYRGRPAGSLGDFGCFSFHETKNVVSGEGGALTVTDADRAARAFIIWEKGTNRRAFQFGQVDKYTWVDCGSSFLPSELTAAVLLAQLEKAADFNASRLAIWNRYHAGFADIERAGRLRRPTVPAHCEHNGHLYYLLLPDAAARNRLIERLRADGIGAPFHYVPLHSAAAGRRFARAHGPLDVTDRSSASLIRLPLHAGMEAGMADHVIDRVQAALAS